MPEPLSQELSQERPGGEATAGAQQRYREAQNTMPRTKRVAGRSAAITVGAVDDVGPELPTTPSQQGEEQDVPRRGVLFSSPSKRPPRMKEPVKQSPLRPKAPPVQGASSTQHIEDSPEDAAGKIAVEKRQPPDPEVEKRKQEKVRLEREIAELESQVTQCTQEIVKEQQRNPNDILPPSEQTDLQAFITKITGAHSKEQVPPPLSTLLCSFLPFSTIALPPPRSKIPNKPIPSHHPIPLANPLPHLEMFTTMKYTTQLGLPRGKIFPSSTRVHQKHIIDITGPQKLLTAQISIVIDALANEIIDMHILRLSPWAKRELGRYLRARAEERDLSNACWAIESYWHIAQKRAQYWHRCESTFSHLLPGLEQENTRPHATHKSKVSRKDLNRHLGRDNLILRDSHIVLKINWRIAFDWTGEAQSEVTVEPAFPSVWTEDGRGQVFGKIPETFGALVQGKGVFGGTRVLVGLLFGDGG